jgi:hypothetical protein
MDQQQHALGEIDTTVKPFQEKNVMPYNYSYYYNSR